jgi:hypothetical protein
MAVSACSLPDRDKVFTGFDAVAGGVAAKLRVIRSSDRGAQRQLRRRRYRHRRGAAVRATLRPLHSRDSEQARAESQLWTRFQFKAGR